jgi:hypothetical protein
MITGGIPPLIDEPCVAMGVYEATYKSLLMQNRKYYTRFPGDIRKVKEIVRYLAGQSGGGVALPSGTLLTPRLFQMLGMSGVYSETMYMSVFGISTNMYGNKTGHSVGPILTSVFQTA